MIFKPLTCLNAQYCHQFILINSEFLYKSLNYIMRKFLFSHLYKLSNPNCVSQMNFLKCDIQQHNKTVHLIIFVYMYIYVFSYWWKSGEKCQNFPEVRCLALLFTGNMGIAPGYCVYTERCRKTKKRVQYTSCLLFSLWGFRSYATSERGCEFGWPGRGVISLMEPSGD
jgi:hypothetical protein